MASRSDPYIPVIDVEGLADFILGELQDYQEEVTEEIKGIVKDVTKECVDDIKANAPCDTGAYKKGWKSKIAFENQYDIRTHIYNAKKPQLTSILERGYAKRRGGRVEGKPHIEPAETRAVEKMEERIREAT